ncbi:tail virion protein G7P-2 [Pseudoduganella violacea]
MSSIAPEVLIGCLVVICFALGWIAGGQR